MADKRWHDTYKAIAEFSLPILKDYYIFKSGCPYKLISEMGSEAEAVKRWDEIILGIINAFQHILNSEWEETKKSIDIDQKYLMLFGKWFTHFWD